MFFSVVFYLFIFALILSLLRNEKNRKAIRMAYGILFLLFVLRYDIGNDYQSYFEEAQDFAKRFRSTHDIFQVLSYNREGREFLIPVLSSIFSFSRYPWVWINLIFSSVFLWCAYKFFDRYKIHATGWLIIFLCEFLFFSWDRVRQGTSIFIILYATTFIDRDVSLKSIAKFVGGVLVATIFHNSAIIGLLYLPLRYLKIPNFVLFITIGVVGVLMWSGIFSDYVMTWSLLFEQVEGYEAYSYVQQTMEQFTSTNYKLRMTMYLLVGASAIVALPRNKYTLYENALLLGLFLFAVASGSMIFTRIAWVFLICMIVVIPLAMKESKGIKKTVLIGALTVFAALFLLDLFQNKMTLGCLPYDSILSPNMYNHYFRPRL